MKRPISELFRHEGNIYVYCSSTPVKRLFEQDLLEQGFGFVDGAIPRKRPIDSLMSVHRDYTICFCGFVPHMQCGSLCDPVYVDEDSWHGCTRVDYARFISGEEQYVIRGKRPAADDKSTWMFL